VRQRKSSSPASIIKAIDQLKKGAKVMMLSAELMRDQIASLERANKAASKRQSVNSVRKSNYRKEESYQRELERIYLLNVRLISRLLIKVVKEESNWVSAASSGALHKV
jgi:hypothetical protein